MCFYRIKDFKELVEHNCEVRVCDQLLLFENCTIQTYLMANSTAEKLPQTTEQNPIYLYKCVEGETTVRGLRIEYFEIRKWLNISPLVFIFYLSLLFAPCIGTLSMDLLYLTSLFRSEEKESVSWGIQLKSNPGPKQTVLPTELLLLLCCS